MSDPFVNFLMVICCSFCLLKSRQAWTSFFVAVTFFVNVVFFSFWVSLVQVCMFLSPIQFNASISCVKNFQHLLHRIDTLIPRGTVCGIVPHRTLVRQDFWDHTAPYTTGFLGAHAHPCLMRMCWWTEFLLASTSQFGTDGNDMTAPSLKWFISYWSLKYNVDCQTGKLPWHPCLVLNSKWNPGFTSVVLSRYLG